MVESNARHYIVRPGYSESIKLASSVWFSKMAEFYEYIDQQKDAFIDDLCELLRIPSVSTDRQYASDVQHAAAWMLAHFERIGLTAQVIETSGHPLVYAETAPVPGAPVVLVYGHYDVQPPDPLDQWITPPFEPTRRDGNLVARGATDDKGQMLTHVKSVEAWLKTVGKLPLQVKFLIEGEEECGSEGFTESLPQLTELLAADCIVISDNSQFAPGQPAITYGLRGITYFELHVSGPKQDLHSGSFGGAVTNPALALVQMLAGLRNGQGQVTIPGFYDDVLPMSDEERQQFANLPFDEQRFMKQLGVDALTGETGYSSLERRWTRPTFDIHGLWGGYQGEGGKTIIPAKAGAKFGFRLVPNQDPAKITEALREKLKQLCPPGVTMELIDMHGAPGFVSPLGSPFMNAAAVAIEQGFGKAPVFIREGGSIPIVTLMQQQLGAEVLLMGWGLDDDNTHSPNEKFSLADFVRGIKASAYLWQELGKIKQS